MITVLMFYRQMPKHSEFVGRMIPAEGHSEYRVTVNTGKSKSRC